MTRVLFFVADESICGTLRVRYPVAGLQANCEWEIKVENYICDEIVGWVADATKSVCIFQRQVNPQILAWVPILQNKGVKCLYEADDLLTQLSPSNPSWKFYTGNPVTQNTIIGFLKKCDGVIVSTDNIKKEWLKYNHNIYVAKNGVDYKDYPIKYNENFRIIISGGSSHSEDWDNCVNFLNVTNYEVHAFGFNEIIKNRPNVIKHDWQEYPKYIEELVNIGGINSLGLAFIKPNVFNGCKSNIKILEYAMCNIPVLASNFGPYQNLPIFYSKDRTLDIGKAVNKIATLDRAECEEFIIKQKQFVANDYDVKNIWKQWYDIINSL
jgi:hypothetical protein